MTLEEFDAALAAIRAEVALAVAETVNPFKVTRLALGPWVALLAVLWPKVSDARWNAGVAARDFYDAERIKHLGETRETWINNYDPDAFQEAMEPYRENISKPYGDTLTESNRWGDAISEMALGAIREVDNGARLTLMEATIGDDKGGFARIDPEPPSCGFCRVLISRGPVYSKSEFRKDHFQYHNADTCILVPVFDPEDFPGVDQYNETQEDLKKAQKLAKDEKISLFTAMEKVRAA